MARTYIKRFSMPLKWLSRLNREDLGVSAAALFFVAVVLLSGHNEILSQVLLIIYPCTLIHKGYRKFWPKNLQEDVNLKDLSKDKKEIEIPKDRNLH